MRRLLLLAAPALIVLVGAMAAAAPPQPDAEATALISRVTQPGVPDQVSLQLATPAADQTVVDYAYPTDGSIVRIASATARVSAQPGLTSSAQGGVAALAVSLFGGEITADSIDVRSSVAAGSASASTDVAESTLTGIAALGQSITPTPNAVIPLADWGSLELLVSATDVVQEPPRSAKATVTALRVKVLVDHGGLPAGSSIEIGTLSVGATAEPAVKVPVAPRAPVVTPPKAPPVIPSNAPHEPGVSIPGAPAELVRPAPQVTAELTTAGGYVFPVFGPASFGDTFGAPRADVSGGWHHGEDIFAPLGTPLLAVADGTVFSVGWNDVGGWRVWLRDRAGNEFYYAHLSAFSPLAVNGRQVKAGDVLGFMGKSGDAQFSLAHLHFEIHPVSLLALGYDGVVAPYPFLTAWRRAQDVSFDAGRSYLPLDGPASARGGVAPPAGAVLLEANDISSASGLVPGALEATLTGQAPKSPAGGEDR